MQTQSFILLNVRAPHDFGVRGIIARAKKCMWHKSKCLTGKNNFSLWTKGYLPQPVEVPCCVAIEWDAQRQRESVKLGASQK